LTYYNAPAPAIQYEPVSFQSEMSPFSKSFTAPMK